MMITTHTAFGTVVGFVLPVDVVVVGLLDVEVVLAVVVLVA